MGSTLFPCEKVLTRLHEKGNSKPDRFQETILDRYDAERAEGDHKGDKWYVG